MSALRDDLTSRVEAIASGKTTASASLEATLERIDSSNDALNAFHETLATRARTRAEAIDEQRRAGTRPGPLAGATIAIKDNICTRDGFTTCSSRMLEGYVSPFDATVIERIEAAGGIAIGKTNLDEFAMGSSSEQCAWGIVRNPADHSRVPGGSSGGSAVAVAANLADAALGSDTGGSIRQPAAFCGVVGFKPTYGRVSRWGLVAFGSSLDQIGPITRSVRDASLLYHVLAGADPRDATTSSRSVEPTPTDGGAEHLRVGVQPSHATNSPAVTAALARAVEHFRERGAEIVDVSIPNEEYGISTYYVIAPAEASSNLARYDGMRYGFRAKSRPGDSLQALYARTRGEGFGPEVRRRIMLGTFLLSSGYHDAYYLQAMKVRRLIKNAFNHAFEQCDVLLGPTTPSPAFKIGATSDPLAMYLNDTYTVNANITGNCAISVPVGRTTVEGSELPIGLHLQAQAFNEATLFRAAGVLEALNESF